MPFYKVTRAKLRQRKVKQVVYNCSTSKSETTYHTYGPGISSDSNSTIESESASEQLKQVKSESYIFDPETNEWRTDIVYHTVRLKPPHKTSTLNDAQVSLPENSSTSSIPLQEPHIPESATLGVASTCTEKETSYAHRRKKLSEGWKSLNESLANSFYNAQAPLTYECYICGIEEPNIVFCRDCGPTAYFCEPCAKDAHRLSTFHIPLRWLGTVYGRFMWYKELRRPKHDCSTLTIPSYMFIIDEKGREHQTVVQFCSCLGKAETLMLLGFWPGSPQNPTTAIDLRFMDKARAFMLEGAVALQKFCASIKYQHSFLPIYPTKIDLYRILSQDCATQHRAFVDKVTHLNYVVPNFPDDTECPVCVKTEDILPKIVSLDGNFRLVRKSSSGVSHCPPHHGSKFFIENDVCKSFILKDQNPSLAHDSACNDFKAGDRKRSAFRNAKLDVTGLFGSVCLHDYPQLFIDLDSGEKLGYAACLISQWTSRPAGLRIMYDIACRLRPQLLRAGIDISKLGLAVPVFHGYAHQANCQIEYNPRLLDLYRNADGENIERLWSYLGQFTYITKEMTASNRRDLLIDALIYQGKKVMKNYATRMKARLETARSEKHKAWVELDQTKNTLRALGTTINDDIIKTWSDGFSHQMKQISKKSQGITWEECYATLLNSFYSLSARLVEPPMQNDEVQRREEIRKLNEKMEKIEQTHGIQRWTQNDDKFKTCLLAACRKKGEDLLKRLHREAVERRHLILIMRDARGHASAAKVAKQLKQTNSRINKLLLQYNQLPGTNILTFDVVKNSESIIFQAMESVYDVPYNLMKEAVVASNRIKRCEEEMSALEIEFPALLSHYQEVHRILDDSLKNEVHTLGVRACIIKEILVNELAQKELVDASKLMLPLAISFRNNNDTKFTDDIHASAEVLYHTPDDITLTDTTEENECLDESFCEDDEDAFASSDEEEMVV